MEIEQITNRFDTHQLTEVLNTDTLKVFDFRRKDGSSHCYQRWIIDRGTLHVTGDNYAAIYNWNSSSITLEFLAKCNLGYFSSKCQADKDGSSQEVFCPDHAAQFLKNLACDTMYTYQTDEHPIDMTQEQWDALSYSEKYEIIENIACEVLELDKHEFGNLFEFDYLEQAIALINDSDYEFMFGQDAWEYVKNLMIPTMTPKMHLGALQVAYAQNPNAF